MSAVLEQLQQGAEGLRAVDLQFARLLARHAAHDADAVALAAALACAALGRGDVCVDLASLAGLPLGGLAARGAPLDAAALAKALRAERGVCADAVAELQLPLVLDGTRLYLGRYWRTERRVAARLSRLALREHGLAAEGVARLRELFPGDSPGAQGQRRACAVALTRGLGVVTGGPGTGKTTTVARLLVVLDASARSAGRSLVVRLAAPTGKAAARAAEALARERAALQAAGALEGIPDTAFPAEATTLHRLLGAGLDGRFRVDAGNPLAADVVVVDECSMVDLRLFDALLDALRADARLLLLGDRDQLEAVEPGNVFGALCAGAGRTTPDRAAELAALGVAPGMADVQASAVNDATAVLVHSYRFDAAGGIGRLAAAVNAGDALGVQAALGAGDPAIEVSGFDGEPPAAELAAGYRPLLEALHAGAADPELLDALERYRVLCALRAGSFGVEGLNRALERALAAARLVDARRAFYPGRLLLVTRNDHALGLYNGDLGLVVPGASGNEEVLFRGAGGQPRRLPPGRIPAHETAFAMTIHKSQGSESDRVCIVLPPAAVAPEFGGREMLYTAITRARQGLRLLLPGGVLEPRWLARAARSSGLEVALHVAVPQTELLSRAPR